MTTERPIGRTPRTELRPRREVTVRRGIEAQPRQGEIMTSTVVGNADRELKAKHRTLATTRRAAADGHPWPPAIPSSWFGQLPSAPIEYLQVGPTAVVQLDATRDQHRSCRGWTHRAKRDWQAYIRARATSPAQQITTAMAGRPR
jgi:hypothetical protein